MNGCPKVKCPHHYKDCGGFLQHTGLLGAVQPIVLHPVEEEAQGQHPGHRHQQQGDQEPGHVLLVAPDLEVILTPVTDIDHVLLQPQALADTNFVTEEREWRLLWNGGSLLLDIGVV